MYRIAIIEDDSKCRAEIRDYLRRYERENECTFEIREFSDGDAVVENYSADYDILLMDIELPLLNGMSAAEEIRRMDMDVEIIFVTNSPQYAIRGYRVGALDYLLKPVKYEDAAQTLDRAISRRKAGTERFLVLNVKGGRQRIRVHSIRYVEVRDHNLTYHTTEGEITTRGTFRETEEELMQEGFFHCNKGILVNLAFVDGIEGQEIRLGSDVLRLGNNRKRAFMDALNRYMSM